MEAGMTTAERRRRRRRGGGLRVPSDNVPRRSGSHPVVPPTPEDPNLAVSIAYSFSDASGPTEREDVDSAPVMAADALPEPAPAVPMPGDGLRRPPTIPPPMRERADRDDAIEAIEAIESIESIPEISVEPGGDVRVDSSPEIALDQVESEEPVDGASAAAPEDISFDGKTREMSAVSLEALGLSVGDGEPEVTEFTPPPQAIPEPVDDVVPAAADDADETAERAVTTPALPGAVPVAAEAEASVDIEMEEEQEAVPITRAYRRTTTVALSEEDLEELMDADAGGDGAPKRAGSPDFEALGDDDLKDEVQAPADASDSGEILTEDLIEEVDSGAAKAVSGAKAASAPGAKAAQAAPAVQPGAAPAPAAAAAAARPRPKTLDGLSTSEAPAAAPATNGAAAPDHGAAKQPPPAPKKEKAAARAAAVAAAVQADTKKRKKGKPWFEEIFDEDYLRTLPFLTPQATQSEARFVIETLAVEPGAQVL